MKRSSKSAGALALALLIPATAATAQDLTISGSVTAATRYVFRAVSFSGNTPVVQPYLELNLNGFYLATWTSNVNFGPGDPTDREIDVYIGYRGETPGGLSYAVNYSRYTYDDLRDNGEFNLNLDYALNDRFGVAADFAYDPVAKTLAAGVGASFAVTDKLTLSADFGNEELLSHLYWDAGATFSLTDTLGADVRYYDTDDAEPFVAASLTYSFTLFSR